MAVIPGSTRDPSALPPGRYTVQATWSGQVQRRVVNIAARGRREAIFYFESAEN